MRKNGMTKLLTLLGLGSIVLTLSNPLIAADNSFAFPATDNNVEFEQIQSLEFRHGDQQIQYGTETLQYGQLYLPENGGAPYPLLIFIHGGCWLNSFDMSHAYSFLTALTQSGFAVWSLEYRRTGDTGGGWPGTFEDIKQGIEFASSLDASSIDTANYILMGHSAGGHLALLAGSELPAASGVIGIAPITNIISYSQGSNSCQTATAQFMGSVYSQNSLAYRQANPAEKTPHPNTLILQGTVDTIVPTEQTRLTGARTELLEGVGHFDWLHPGSSAFEHLIDSIKEMLPR
jgi:acetyl esterase/lipase